MITRSKKVKLEWKLNPSAFALINKEVIGEKTRNLGSTIAAVGKMMERGEELRSIMPTILGSDPTSTTVNWTDLVLKYWSGISIQVPPAGKEFEIGFHYELNDFRKKDHIQALVKANPDIKTDEDLANFVEGTTDKKPNVTSDERYRYGTPISPEQYIHWRFATFHREVANTFSDVNKSSHIRFYLYSEEELQEARKITFKTSKDALTKYLQILGNKSEVDSILTVYEVNISTMNDLDKDMMLKGYAESDPKRFLSIANDPNLKTKALIERYILKGLLKRLSNTDIIVDANNPAIVVGNTVSEAITFFSPDNVKSKAIVAELEARYKATI
jgi:hypothetical protein